ncbi:MAG: zinc-dependent metalloprotease [Prevotella sp.]|jgi:hypothetical protein|nr:zinc-dependent metalloprotease [Prevotella sp.]MCI2081388.1 zinc-dependent metalloprotease [Prevotella sp.]MCI2103271.1 zinc-dependent metalloprotease [Prevotella sp.]
MKKLLTLLILALFIGLPTEAKKKKDQKTPPKKEAPVKSGLFSVQHDGEKWFFQIPDSLLGRPFLATTRYISTPVNAGVYGGEEVNEQTFYWEKADNKLLLRSLIYESVADSSSAIFRAVKASTQDPIVESFKIEATVRDSVSHAKRYKIEIGKLFSKENQAVGLTPGGKKRFNLLSMNSDRSFIKSINTYPINTEIKTVRTYSCKDDSRLPSALETGVATFEMNTSFVMLPKNPMRRRLFDPRVGYFAGSYTPFSDDQQEVKTKLFISRWRLEPKDEDIEKMKRGELVEPKKQIVYYIDPATPKQWRPYLIQGVNDWNKAFEKAGFKNAIVAKEWPNDSTMSMEDARFSVIRYLASPISNAYGPHVSDPRTGEILESHVGWYHNVMKLVHDWYMIQAGCVDPAARKMKFDDELMGQLIRFVSSHEIGHTLGLRHNMGASSATPVDSLRNKAWVEKYGHTASIMDYARFNYVAQPEDNISRAGIFPRINDYDKWAIEWGYKPIFDTKDEEADKLILNKWIVKQLAKSPRYWFGGEGYDNNPKAQTEDLGDNSMKASEYGLKNLKRIVKLLPQWTYEEGDMGDNLKGVYSNLIGQFIRYEGHVLRNIGGVYTHYKSVEEPGAIYTPETKAKQQEALAYLNRNVFTEPTWLISEPYINRISQSPLDILKPIASRAASTLVSASMFNNISKYAYGADPYQPTQYISDLVALVFKEAATGSKVSAYRRYLQNEMVKNATTGYASASGDGQVYLASFLRAVRSKISAARSTDSATQAHYANMVQMIKDAFERKTPTSSPMGSILRR